MKQKHGLSFLVVGAMILLLTGCGQNVLKGLAPAVSTDTSSVSGLQTALDNATTTSDYVAIAQGAQTIAEDTTLPTATRQEAYFLLSEAQMGEAGVTMLDLVSAFGSGASTSGSGAIRAATVGSTTDIYSKLASILNASTLEGVYNAALNAINAYNLSIGTVDTNKKFYKGLTCLAAAINLINYQLDISGNTVTIKSGVSATIRQVMTGIMDQDSNSLTDDSIFLFATEGRDALADTGSFSNDQLTQVDLALTKATDVKSLYEGINSASVTSQTYNGTTYSLSTATSDADILAALNDIFKG